MRPKTPTRLSWQASQRYRVLDWKFTKTFGTGLQPAPCRASDPHLFGVILEGTPNEIPAKVRVADGADVIKIFAPPGAIGKGEGRLFRTHSLRWAAGKLGRWASGR